jgi:hypothetical protein
MALRHEEAELVGPDCGHESLQTRPVKIELHPRQYMGTRRSAQMRCRSRPGSRTELDRRGSLNAVL